MRRQEIETRALAVFARRLGPGADLARESHRIARACQAMATRFRHGGTLLTFGTGPAAADAAHLAVEFIHPVTIGKPALPAISLSCDPVPLTGATGRDRAGRGDAGEGAVWRGDEGGGVFAGRVRGLAGPRDIALGLSADGGCAAVLRGLEVARGCGALTVALTGGDGGGLARSPAVDHLIVVASDDPCVVREMHVTVYHVLWELVHVFLERPEAWELEASS